MACSCFPIISVNTTTAGDDNGSDPIIPLSYLNGIGGGGGGENKIFTKTAAKFQLLISTIVLLLTVGFLLKSAHNIEKSEGGTTTLNLFLSENAALVTAMTLATLIFIMSFTFLVGVDWTGPRFLSGWIWVYFFSTLILSVVFLVRHDYLGKDGTFLVVAGIFAIFFMNFILVRVVMMEEKGGDEENLVQN